MRHWFFSLVSSAIVVQSFGSAYGETIYLGPHGYTASGHPGVQTRTILEDFERYPKGATARLKHSELQSGWQADVRINCESWVVRFNLGRNIKFSIKLASEGPVISLPFGGTYILDRPQEFQSAYNVALEQTLDNPELGAVHRGFHGHLNLFGFLAGHLAARACMKE